jgi:DNA-binding NarL/FixJ family response regulator
LRQDPHLKQTLVLVVTDSISPHDRSAAYQLGAVGYLLKSTLDHDCTPLLDLLEAYRHLVESPAVELCLPLGLFLL